MSLIPSSMEGRFSRSIDSVVGTMGRSHLRPNAISTAGILLNLAAGCFLVEGQFFVGGVLILMAGILDLVDGKFARLTSQVSIFGAIYDATMDRIGELAIYTGMGVYFVMHHMYMTAILVVLATSGSLLVSYVRARAESFNIPCDVGFLRRGERILVVGLGSMLNFLKDLIHEPLRWAVSLFHVSWTFTPAPLTIALFIVAVLAPITVAQRLLHVKRHEPPAA